MFKYQLKVYDFKKIIKLDLINYANDERFAREILKYLLNQLSNFIDNLRGIKCGNYIHT